ncbi:MAG: hypothetical protein UR68_C0015G0025 [Candidatus Roizmanbacteria bacterium GW2011_GWA2_35_19]|uniref:Uncharacterized protein n=1 Tax=Candidatus Roizmanbacteria bacterium GW2011_GWA2_35_19 TaxID=1618478 RepID=A0A0G0BSI1_9BACT|nr:MAG: hypothetical protein UR68_C0015G0025 [Candidatus Roizmanbacteria bacterium GW2011_GWA2_35_19]
MIYKGFEFSRSLNGDDIVYIARNPVGLVIYRAKSESDLKKVIDNAIEERRRREEQVAQNLQAQERSKNKRRGFAAKKKEEVIAQQPIETTTATPKIHRDSTGKFVSQSQKKEDIKKSFWDQLRS